MKATANIYVDNSIELRPSQREEIYEGLEIIGAEIGSVSVQATKRITLKANSQGLVAPEKVGLKNLPYLVDLHLIIAPLASPGYEYQRLGLSFRGTGVTFINSLGSLASLRTTTPHEVAHSLGYVLPNSHHSDPHSTTHCADPTCIMHRSYEPLPPKDPLDEIPATKALKTLLGKLTGNASTTNAAITRRAFCGDCKSDFSRTIDQHERRLKNGRIISKGVGVSLAHL